MIESKGFLTDAQLAKTVSTYKLFCRFLGTDLPELTGDSQCHAQRRRWKVFFDKEDGIVRTNKDATTVSVFLGFNSAESEYLIHQAKEKAFTLIGPDGSHYKVLE